MPIQVSVEVVQEDALAIAADVLALKYAQDLYGVDALVAECFTKAGHKLTFPHPDDFQLVQRVPGIAASTILFVGVAPLYEFGYREIRTFGRKVLSLLATAKPDTHHIAVTVHGPGYGLDAIEAFEAELAGLIDAIRSHDMPKALQKITIVERRPSRAQLLQQALAELLPHGQITVDGEPLRTTAQEDRTERLRAAGYASDSKANIFVAMPFREDMDDVYDYGIQGAARAAGFVCERADLSSFTGDILEWVKKRIKSASLLVADLTDANPNVYLEVGYAWGCGIPTILLVHDTDHLKFDVRGQRCLVYKRIKDLEEALSRELNNLGEQSNV
jgi:hypothetical protein